MHVNAALPSRAALLRQSGVLRQIRSEQNLPNAYRNSPSYATLPPSRRAVRSNAMKRILIIEDDRDIVELVRYNLASDLRGLRRRPRPRMDRFRRRSSRHRKAQ